MELSEKKIYLRNGKECILRSPRAEDAKEVLSHIKITSGETLYMARYPEEIKVSVKEEEILLDAWILSRRNLMIAAFIDNKLIANAAINGVRNQLKYLHRADFGISIQRQYWNLGIGSAILTEMIPRAKEMGYEQIELEVVCENEKAIQLYKKFGFEIYAMRKNSFKYKDGSYKDEYLMMRNL